jgi:hypothetical protein
MKCFVFGGLRLSQKDGYPEVFRCFLQSLKTNTGIQFLNGRKTASFQEFQIHHPRSFTHTGDTKISAIMCTILIQYVLNQDVQYDCKV